MNLLATICLLSSTFSPALRVRDTDYAHIAIVSDVICVGTVESATPVGSGGRRDPKTGRFEVAPVLARVKLEEVWKGSWGSGQLSVIGSSTWTCDVTHLQAGDHLVLFLTCASDAQRDQSLWHAEVEERLDLAPLYSVCWAGRGALPIVPPEFDEPGGSDDVAFKWLPWLDREDRAPLPTVKETIARILKANALGTVRHPITGRPARAAVLRSDVDAAGRPRTSVIAAVFDCDEGADVYWSVAATGSGAPFRCEELEWDETQAVTTLPTLKGARKFLLALPSAVPLEAPHEWIVTRDPLFTMTRAGVPLMAGETVPTGAEAKERVLWNEMRARILSVRPKVEQDAVDVVLRIVP